MSTPPSRFVWHDLSAHDVEAAKRFYGELFMDPQNAALAFISFPTG